MFFSREISVQYVLVHMSNVASAQQVTGIGNVYLTLSALKKRYQWAVLVETVTESPVVIYEF